MTHERIVSVGFLSEADLKTLGAGFTRHFPVAHDDVFADLLGQLDEIEAVPVENGVMLKPQPKGGG